jgi:membrane peptidoglycan carboxypeptidase
MRRPPAGGYRPGRSGRRWSIAIAVAVAGLLLASLTGYAALELQKLPEPGRGELLSKSIYVYDRNGKLIAERNSSGAYQVPVRLAEMGKTIPAATLAAEDRDFYRHGAVSGIAMARAAVTDILSGSPVEGGSTLTQQLVKIELLRPERSLGRKLQEAYLAYAIEHRYSKDQILEMYLNRVYYGHGAYGIGAAARVYFGREPRDLTPAQAAFLAGLLQAPSANDPQVHFAAARDRELYVLRGMVSTRALTQADADRAAQEDVRSALHITPQQLASRAPHFVDHVLSRLEQQFGSAAIQSGGLRIYTTLDLDLQTLAERAVADGVGKLSGSGVNNADLVAAHPATGEVLAWVGSADYANDAIGGQFDVALSRRQPGSSFKPYVYAAALRDKKVTLASALSDSPTSFGGYRPLDFDNRFMGPMCARQALLLSRNVPAVQVASLEGIDNVGRLAHDMGVGSPIKPELQSAIGGSPITMLDNVQGYATLANQGERVPLVTISRVVDLSNRVLYQQDSVRTSAERVLGQDVSYLVTDVLKGYQDQWQLGFRRQMASKSGTSGGAEGAAVPDAWMMAYNRDVVVGTWAGRTAATPDYHGTITTYGVNVGKAILSQFVNGLPTEWSHWYAKPANVVQGRGGELFLAGTDSNQSCGRGQLPGPGGGDKKKDGDQKPAGGGDGGGGEGD